MGKRPTKTETAKEESTKEVATEDTRDALEVIADVKKKVSHRLYLNDKDVANLKKDLEYLETFFS